MTTVFGRGDADGLVVSIHVIYSDIPSSDPPVTSKQILMYYCT